MTDRTYTWEQIAQRTGYTIDDLDALTAEWIHGPGYLDERSHQPTQATLDLLQRQAGNRPKTRYLVETYGSADGEIWQALDAVETVEIEGDWTNAAGQDWLTAADVAQESGAVPGSYTRVLVWPEGETDLSVDRAIHEDVHHVGNTTMTAS